MQFLVFRLPVSRPRPQPPKSNRRTSALLNTPLHFHGVVVDGCFKADAAGGVSFRLANGLDLPAIAEVQTAVRQRLLRTALRHVLLSAKDAQVMAEWEHGGGFSVDARVAHRGTRT